MLFNFRLRPIDQIEPWHQKGEPVLHWFGLTDGWYWMDVGSVELFRYTDAILSLWSLPVDSEERQPYVNYQVVRLWEDLQEMLPSVLEPVPDYILKYVKPDTLPLMWLNRMNDQLRSNPDMSDDVYDLYEQALSWLNHRVLDVGYLQAGPRICIWTQEETVVIHWDNRSVQVEGIPVWKATVGSFTLPLKVFVDELRAFDQHLMQDMESRIGAVDQHWSRPDITVDVATVVREQQDRATSMERSLIQATSKPQTSWQVVLDALERLTE